MRRPRVQGAFRTAKHRAGITTTGVAIPPLRHAYATHLLEAGVHPRLLQRSLGHPQRATTMLS
jgi:site-specific recombinase XerD